MIRKLFPMVLALSFIAFNTYSQIPKSQRMVLCEEFTQASSGICASLNPVYNALLHANSNKVVAISYHISLPGIDPMNAHNPTQIQNRQDYYNVTALPLGIEDGNMFKNSIASYTQTDIDNESQIASPFTIALSHQFSTKSDSVYIKCIITSTTAFTYTGPLKAYIVMTEDSINFPTTPGTNSETVFYNVMKKMYPDEFGAPLPLTWNIGDADTIKLAVPMPSYIYDLHKVAFVAFIQDNANKNVKQAAYNSPLPVVSNASVTAIAGVPAYQCTNSQFSPLITLKNTSLSDTLHTAEIVYFVDNNSSQTYIWTGTLAPNTATTVTLPAITPSNGLHLFNAYAVPYLGLMYLKTTKFIIEPNAVNAPVKQDFESPAFPPANWIIDYSNPNYNWTIGNASAMDTGVRSATFPCFYIPAGNLGSLYTAPLNLSGFTALKMAFDVAYAQYQTESDKLEVQYSINCGTSWVNLYTKSGATLATAASSTQSFVPTSSDWRTELIDLAAIVGQTDVLIRFKATSAWGNNIYVDNINVATEAAINKNLFKNDFKIYPNPANTKTNISFNLNESKDVSIKVVNMMGEIVSKTSKTKLPTGNNTIELNTEKLSAGIYFISLSIGGDYTVSKKLSVNR